MEFGHIFVNTQAVARNLNSKTSINMAWRYQNVRKYRCSTNINIASKDKIIHCAFVQYKTSNLSFPFHIFLEIQKYGLEYHLP